MVKLKNPKGKGSTWELAVRNYYESRGKLVIKPGGSKVSKKEGSDPIDLFVMESLDLVTSRAMNVWVIECKSNLRGYVEPEQRARIKEFCDKWHLKCLVAFPKHGVYSKKEGNVQLKILEY